MQHKNTRGAVILAGGDSKRLGQVKPLLLLDGMTLIERAVVNLNPFFNRITVVTDRPEVTEGLPVKRTTDLLTGYPKSPLRGIHAGLSASELPFQFVMACDMPFINLALIRYMAAFAPNYDAVVPRVGDYYQPLYAYYCRSCLEPIRRQLEEGGGKVTRFYETVNVKFISESEIIEFDPQQESFFNINYWDDYTEAVNRFRMPR
ncbi:MAG: molybdenum cofactor guanylyltransferase [Bacillota bacterium]